MGVRQRLASTADMPPQRKNGAQKKVVDKSGLGRAIINRKARQAQAQADPLNHTTELAGGLHSVTQEDDLAEFLNTAALADTSFEAEKQNVKVISSPSASAAQHNPFLLTAEEERELREKHIHNQQRLRVPRRPAWDKDMKVAELERRERDSFLDWRRGLAELSDKQSLLMTPFERNIEVWRQLWWVIERSDLIVQIVDARNPLLFRSEDLEKYVKEVDPKKRNLLLVNKADMMTEEQRRLWAEYFHEQGINYKFFSAHLAKEINEGRDAMEELDARQIQQQIDRNMPQKTMINNLQDLNLKEQEEEEWSDEDDDEESEISEDDDEEEEEEGEVGPSAQSVLNTQILTVAELEELFLENISQDSTKDRKTTIGLVGYPNVGKSSTINALIGAKKVSVSSTPGKTKHFQTIHLSDRVILCDCPGLVFPNFATTKAELVCNGVLPIDQLREFTGPAGLVARRIPHAFLENVYGMKITMRPLEEGGTGTPTAEEILSAYAKARGFATTGHGQPDESRAARYILKDYVSGKLLYCHPPPHDPDLDGAEFNEALYDFAHLPAKRQAWLIAHNDEINLDGNGETETEVTMPVRPLPETGNRSKNLDKRFFGPGSGNAGHVTMPFNHQYSEQWMQQKQLTGRKAKTLAALEKDVDPAEMKLNSKRHFKGARRKQRNVRAADDEE